MTVTTDRSHSRSIWRIARWSAAAVLLALPAVAMRFTPEVNWTAGDFVAAALLLGVPLLSYEVVARRSSGSARAGTALALLAGFLLVWINLAVGIIGDEGDPANLMFAGVLAVAVGGSIVARGRSCGLARAMLATVAAQVLVAAIAVLGSMGADGPIWPLDTLGVTAILATLWLAAAALFARAARR